MASNTRQAVREAIIKRNKLIHNYIKRLEMLFDNCVVCENLPDDLPKRYLLKVLRENGGIAYDIKTKLFLRFTPLGLDTYGLPKLYTLYGYDGIMYTRNARDVVILRTSDNEYCIQDYFKIQAEKLVDLDLAIEQNLDAVKTMSLVEFDDEKSALSLVNLNNAKRLGATVAFVNKKTLNSENTSHRVYSTNATYLGGDLLEARRKILNETLSSIGINVANVDKKERVQGEEIRASQGYGIDCLKVLCDTFNYDAEQSKGLITMRLKGNTSLYEQYMLDTEKTKSEIKEGDKTNG